jgi:hypothetical protein
MEQMDGQRPKAWQELEIPVAIDCLARVTPLETLLVLGESAR